MTQLLLGCLVVLICHLARADAKTLYENNFEKESIGQIPTDFLVLDGAFAVKEENGNKFLELPGTPLDSYAVQFGPAQTDNISLSAKIAGTSKGRRYPTFGIGLNGAAGYRLQISPAKKALELFKDQELKKSLPYDWQSGHWTKFRLQARKIKEGEWKIEGKAWEAKNPEPQQWMLSADETQSPSTGKSSVFASPFSGTPLQFDDLVVSSIE